MKNKYFGDRKFYKMILTIALPIIIQSLFTNVVSMLDNVMVGQIGTDQMTGVAIVNQLFFVFYLAVFGGMSGAGIFSAQYFGQKNNKGVRNVFRMKLVIGIIISIISLIVFLILGNPLINMFLHEGSSSGNIDATFKYARSFLVIMLFSIPPFVLANCYGSTLKEAGETLVPMKAGVLAVIFDFVLNLILIFGLLGFPKLGVVGAAIATVISRYVECGYLVLYTHLKKNKFAFIIGVYNTLKVPTHLTKQILAKGIPLLINEFLWAAGLTLQTQALSTKGLAAIASLNIANTVNNVFNNVFLTLGLSISIVVGQLLGAGKIKEAKETDTKMIVFSLMASIGIAILLALSAPFFPLIYKTTGEIQGLATIFVFVLACIAPFVSFTNSAYFTLRSGGKTIITFLFDSCFIICVNVPIAMLLVHFTTLGIIPIFIIVNSLEIIKSTIGFIMVKKGVWLNTIVD